MKKVLSILLLFALLMNFVPSFAVETKKNDADKTQSTVDHNGVEYDLSTLEGASKYFHDSGTNPYEKVNIEYLKKVLDKQKESNPVGTTLNYGIIMRSSTYDLETQLRTNAATLNALYAGTYLAQYMATGDPIFAASVAYLSTAMVFADNVKIGGDWDLKQELGGYNQYHDTEIDGDTYYLSGEDIGNIHYGFVGSTLFSPQILKAAAGLVQIVGGEYRIEWYSTYFDDPDDQIAIQRGIDYFNSGEFE